MRDLAILLTITVLFAIPGVPQNMADAPHAPDGGTREMVMSIMIPPMPNAPFSTTLDTQWIRKLEDGSTLTLQNRRIIMRDGAGRIFQERSRLVPPGKETTVVRFELADPVKHQIYFCDPYQHVCELRAYFARPVPLLAKPPNDANRNITHENLGTKSINGVEAAGSRETMVVSAGTAGNSHPLTISKEFWYSAQLGFNLIVKRVDPRHGTESFEVRDLTTAEPEATFFSVPPGYRVIDLRRQIKGSAGAAGSR